MKKIISIVLLTLLIGIPNASAKDYSVKVGTRNDNVASYCDWPIVSANCDDKKDPARVGVGQVFHISGHGESLNGYCIDPPRNTPEAGIYVEVEDLSEISAHLEALKYICKKTEGNNDLRIAVMKAYSANSGLYGKYETLNDNQKKVINNYKGLFDGTTVWNKDFGQGLSAGQDVLNGALALKNKTTSEDKIYFTNENGKLILTTTVAGKIEIADASKYAIYINGSKQTSSIIEVKPGTYQIELKGECKAGEDFSSDVSFSYDKDDLTGISSSEYSIRYFKKKESTTKYQRLIVCDKNDGSYPNCDEKGNCKITDKIKVTCEAEKCEEPVVKSGNAVCDSKGMDIVEITEAPNDLAYNNTNCITKLPDATKTILGDDDNSYCKIYCSENYKLVLPGPNSGNDKNVSILAGSFFTIDDSNMHDETTFTCYGQMDYSKYTTDIYNVRKKVVEKYNKVSEAEALIALLEKLTPTGEDSCNVDGSYKKLVIDTNGKITSTTEDIHAALTKCTDAQKSSTIKEGKEYTVNAKTELQTAINDANKTIKEANAEWNACTSWNFDELNKIIEADENCHADIDFQYQFDVCGITIDKVGDIEITNEKTKASTSKDVTLYTGVCNESGDLTKCNTTTTTKAYTYLNKSETVIINYEFDNDFRVNWEENNTLECDATKTGEQYSKTYKGFPVSIKATQSKYAYEYTYSNIGHDFEAMNAGTCKMGRYDDEIKEQGNSQKCYYDVNDCVNCKSKCEDPSGNNCDIPLCDGECKIACVGAGCITDFGAGFLATYRTLSLNNPFPNVVAYLSSEPAKVLAVVSANEASSSTSFKEITGGSNWTSDKGLTAGASIKNLGEGIYNGEPQYSITLTPTVISEIKKYNAKQENEGNGYLNSSLDCKDVTGKNYGQCISTFVHSNEWDFEINQELGENQVLVNGTPFIPYSGETTSFVGPAWK